MGVPTWLRGWKRSRSERTSGEVEQGRSEAGEGVEGVARGSFPLVNRSVPDLSNVFRVPLAIHTRPACLRSAHRPPASIFLFKISLEKSYTYIYIYISIRLFINLLFFLHLEIFDEPARLISSTKGGGNIHG